jgi:hypothetical protein
MSTSEVVATGGAEITGRCLCGAIRYRCGSPIYPPTLCHCESCRRASGAHVVGWITVQESSATFTAGEPREIASSPGVKRTFCGRCGTPLTYRSERRAGEVDFTIGSLDSVNAVVPLDHIWMVDAPSWDRPADGLPQHAKGRSSVT